MASRYLAGGLDGSSYRFADLNLQHDVKSPGNTLALVRQAIALGYDAVAINIDVGEITESVLEETIDDELPKQTKKKKKKNRRLVTVPEPYVVKESELDLTRFTVEGKKFRQYTRITVSVAEGEFLHAFNRNEIVKKYDLIAIRPLSEQVFSTLVSKPDIADIISFDPSTRVQWLSKGKMLRNAVEKGLSIELIYSPGLMDSSARQQLFSNAGILIKACGKGKGVIFTSGAERPIQLRGPFDVANLATLFGSLPKIGNQAVSDNPRKVLLRADTKQTVKGAVFVQDITKVPKSSLAKLLKVPEFRVEIEKVGLPTSSPNSNTGDTKNKSDDQPPMPDNKERGNAESLTKARITGCEMNSDVATAPSTHHSNGLDVSDNRTKRTHDQSTDEHQAKKKKRIDLENR